MKKLIIYFTVFILILALLTGCTNTRIEKKENKQFKIVASFYPIYIMALNLTNGMPEVVIENMTNTNVGCLHDYTLMPKDLIKLENADLFITNGLGLENFLDTVTAAYSDLITIDLANGIQYIIEEESEINAHTWLDIDNYIGQLGAIKQALIEQNPENTNKYNENYDAYLQELNTLKKEVSMKITREEKLKAVSFSETIEYIGNWAKLDMVTIHTNHEGDGLSAEKLNEIIKYVKENNIKIILIDEETSIKNVKSLAEETGAKIYKLNSGLYGNGEKNSYIRTMEQNINVVENMEEK